MIEGVVFDFVLLANIFEAATRVTTPLALLAFATASWLVWQIARSKHETNRLKSLPEDKRAQQIDEFLTRYRITGSNLTRKQKLQLIQEELRKRHALKLYGLIAILAAFVVCFGMSVVGWSPSNQSGPSLEELEAELSEAKQAFVEKDFERAQRLFERQVEYRKAEEHDSERAEQAVNACNAMLKARGILSKYAGTVMSEEDASRFSTLMDEANRNYPYFASDNEWIQDPTKRGD